MEENAAREELKKLEKEIEAYQKRQGMALANLTTRITAYAIKKLEEFFQAPASEVLEFLENNPELLDYRIIDAEIKQIRNPLVKFAVDALIRAGGRIIKDGWKREFLESGELYILLALRNYNPSLYHILRDKRNVLSFIKSYIAYRLGLSPFVPPSEEGSSKNSTATEES